MLTYEDCLALCDFDESEILAFAEHEHIPPIIAIELAQYLIEKDDGTRLLKKMIVEDIDAARARNDDEKVKSLTAALKHFVVTHPDFPLRAQSGLN